MEQDKQFRDSLRDLAQILRLIGPDRLKEYIYRRELIDDENVTEEDEELFYIPDFIETVLEDPDTANISLQEIWEEIADENYISILNGIPLDFLTVAVIWFATGYEMKTGPFEQLKDTDERDIIVAILNRIIDEEIIQVSIQIAGTDYSYSHSDFLDLAFGYKTKTENSLKAQRKLFKKLEKIIGAQSNAKILDSYDDIFVKATYRYILKNKEINDISRVKSVELDLFDDISVSSVIPVCVGNFKYRRVSPGNQSDKQTYIKVHLGGQSDMERYHKNRWIKENPQTSLVLYVYTGEDESLAQNAHPKDFVMVKYSMKSGNIDYRKFAFDSESKNVSIIKDRINRHMKKYYLESSKNVSNNKSKVVKKCIVPNLVYDDDMLMALYRENPMLKFIEKEDPWTQKKILRFNILFIEGGVFSVKKYENKTYTTLVRKNGILSSITNQNKAVVLKITASNDEQYNLAKFFVLRFLQDYKDNYDRLLAEHNRIFDNAYFGLGKERIIPEQEQVNLYDDEAIPNIKALRAVDPGLWSGLNYARNIAPRMNLQVMPIKETETEYYLERGREVILWPVEVTGLSKEKQTTPSIDAETNKPLRVFYTTFSDENPYINLVENPGKNRDMYPLVPKAQASRSKFISIDTSNWSISYFEKNKDKPTNDVLTILKPLKIDRYGNIKGNIPSYLGVDDFWRFGVTKSKSSFLHCALLAVDGSIEDENRKFANIYNTKKGEDKVRSLRKFLGNYASVCMQENSHLTVEQVREELSNPDVFLDPSRHYRAVEEFLGINIFTAVSISHKELFIEPPKAEKYYVRSKRRELLGGIIIVKLNTSRDKTKKDYQCELVCFGKDFTQSLFNKEIVEKLEMAVDAQAKAISIKPTTDLYKVKAEEDFIKLKQEIDVSYTNRNKITLPLEFLARIKSQKIDSFGKLRGVEFDIGNNKTLWMICPPLEPLSGPNSGDEDIEGYEPKMGSIPLAEIKPNDKKDIAELKNFPFMKYKGLKFVPNNKQLVGLWLNIFDVDFFIPLIPTPWEEKHEKNVNFDIPMLISNDESEVDKLLRLKKVMCMYIQIVKRLFVMSKLTPEEFIKENLIVVGEDHYITTEGGSYLIPQIDTFEAMKKHFISLFPSFFKGDKLVCTSQRMFTNISLRILRFQNGINDEIAAFGNSKRLTDFPPFLQNFYATIKDFTKHSPTEVIFDSVERFEFEKNNMGKNRLDLFKDLKTIFSMRREPYIYLHEDKTKKALFMVQNVVDGNASRAATVALYWRNNKVNNGYFTTEFADPESVKIINVAYNKAGKFEINIENPNEAMILKFPDNKYSALLSLNH